VNDKDFRAALRQRDTEDPAAAKASRGRAEEQRRVHLDQLLDQALNESFPASDSTSIGRSS
jgi:hypothetical protein